MKRNWFSLERLLFNTSTKKLIIICAVFFAGCSTRTTPTFVAENLKRVTSYFVEKDGDNFKVHITVEGNPTPWVQPYEATKFLAIKAILDQGNIGFDIANNVLRPLDSFKVLTQQNQMDSLLILVQEQALVIKKIEEKINLSPAIKK